jgi:hypothetical protein
MCSEISGNVGRLFHCLCTLQHSLSVADISHFQVMIFRGSYYVEEPYLSLLKHEELEYDKEDELVIV